MAGLRDSLKGAVRGFYCATSGPAAAGLQLLGNTYNGLGAEDQGDDLLASAAGLRAVQDVVCDRPPDASDVAGLVPFQGGQCPGVQYNLAMEWRTDGQGPFTVTGSAQGPIRLDTGVRNQNGINFEYIDFGNAQGLGGTGANVSVSRGQFNQELNLRVLSATAVRDDGEPDDCGNTNPTLPTYDPNLWTSPVPVLYDPVGGGPSVEIEPTIKIDPHLNVGGNIIAPISVTFQDGSSLFGDFNLNTGDINFGPGNSGGGGAGTGPSEGDPEVPPEEQPGVLVGLRVVSSELGGGSSTIIYQEDAPNFVIPRTGMVNFAYEVGGSISWGVPVNVRNLDQVIWAEAGAVDWAVTPGPGWELDVTPLFGPDCPPCSSP